MIVFSFSATAVDTMRLFSPIRMIAVPTTTARPATALAGAWELRAPTLAELDEATATADPDAMLRARCLSPLTSDAAPPSTAQLDAALDQVSGTAALHGQVACAECDSTFDSGLDIAALLWHRICAAAPRVLEDVAALASAFGWSEAAILALPASRRTHYLSLAGATG